LLARKLLVLYSLASCTAIVRVIHPQFSSDRIS
jgi:hypothetical protein